MGGIFRAFWPVLVMIPDSRACLDWPPAIIDPEDWSQFEKTATVVCLGRAPSMAQKGQYFDTRPVRDPEDPEKITGHVVVFLRITYTFERHRTRGRLPKNETLTTSVPYRFPALTIARSCLPFLDYVVDFHPVGLTPEHPLYSSMLTAPAPAV